MDKFEFSHVFYLDTLRHLCYKSTNMKPSTTFICAGMALLFLAAFYSIAPTLVQCLYSNGLRVEHTPNMFYKPGIFAWNYWFCEILGIVFLWTGFRKLLNEQ